MPAGATTGGTQAIGIDAPFRGVGVDVAVGDGNVVDGLGDVISRLLPCRTAKTVNPASRKGA